MRLLGGGAAPLSFPSFVQSGKTQGADYTGAANQQYGTSVGNYNSQQAEQAGLEKGLFSLAAAIAPAVIGSDRRIKSDIKFLGHHGGHKWYSYIKFGQPEVGVMAQDVMLYNPGAVLVHPSGYLMVNYGAL